MTKILTVLAAFLIGSLAVMADSVEDQKKEINRIKKNLDEYLSIEHVDSLEDVALTKAKHYLQELIEEYVQNNKNLKDASSVVAMNMKSQSITMPRGDKYRAFAYIKKSDILAADNASVTTYKKVSSTEEAKSAGSSAKPISTTQPIATRRSETIARLLTLQRFAEVQPALDQMKKDGHINEYAKYKELKDPTQYVLIIYNKNGDVEAVLSEGRQRTNQKTGQPDDVTNYKGRAALGVKVND